jgi:hypothetical protein
VRDETCRTDIERDCCAPVYALADFPLSVAIYAIREIAGVVVWCMFLVLTREFELSITIGFGRFYLNMFEHKFRISRLMYPMAYSAASRD